MKMILQTTLSTLIHTIGFAAVEKMAQAHILGYQEKNEIISIKELSNKDNMTIWESNTGDRVAECVLYFNGVATYEEVLELGTVVTTQADPVSFQGWEQQASTPDRIAVRKALRKIFEAKELTRI